MSLSKIDHFDGLFLRFFGFVFNNNKKKSGYRGYCITQPTKIKKTNRKVIHHHTKKQIDDIFKVAEFDFLFLFLLLHLPFFQFSKPFLFLYNNNQFRKINLICFSFFFF